MNLHIGTSGYSYKEWKGSFYPDDLAAAEMLEYYAQHFSTVEINNTFYRMPSGKAVEQWRDTVPDDFRFVVKASRRITHMKRLRNVEEETAYLFETVDGLGDKLGPVLFQLPPFLKKDLERLEAFLACVPADRRVVLEFRNDSWDDDETKDALRAANAMWCITDDGTTSPDDDFVSTADSGYLRLRDDAYDAERMASWARRIREQDWTDAWIYFKHEDEGKGPEFAKRFAELLA